MADKDQAPEDGAKSKGGMRKKIILVVPVLLLVAAAAWFFLLRGHGDAAQAKAIPVPTPGPVVTLDPITINLAGGHFLKVGLALQTDKSAKEVDGSRALDLAISEFSGQTIDDLSSPEGREHAKQELLARIKFAYLPEGKDAEAAAQQAMGVALGRKAPPPGKTSAKGKKPAPKPKPIEPQTLTAQQVINAGSGLTVLPMVYDVYFTEFVMQ
jgi:flagellar FliL protein